ncbi:hypothetical protein T265_08173 [Opisthorchis viverrini]|uniref:Uncharacterized protein n=1 Tax=Opisthorchis viverrini TaxID=6198 RepID=A0A074ZAD5_OPIVI|nr:hypothetical protein T265_08173 [Opisthorchis viverrini]KER24083.1 hypothetical protein T265_08173 [Opisthorchis viverrini]
MGRSVRRAWQLACKRFAPSRGDIDCSPSPANRSTAIRSTTSRANMLKGLRHNVGKDSLEYNMSYP